MLLQSYPPSYPPSPASTLCSCYSLHRRHIFHLQLAHSEAKEVLPITVTFHLQPVYCKAVVVSLTTTFYLTRHQAVILLTDISSISSQRIVKLLQSCSPCSVTLKPTSSKIMSSSSPAAAPRGQYWAHFNWKVESITLTSWWKNHHRQRTSLFKDHLLWNHLHLFIYTSPVTQGPHPLWDHFCLIFRVVFKEGFHYIMI